MTTKPNPFSSRVILGIVFACSSVLSSPAFADFEVGEMVVVIQDTQIRVGDNILQQITRGVGLKVQAVSDEWLWVSNEATGWIPKHHVATPIKAIEVFTAEIKRNPRDADAHLCRGLAWFDKHEVDIAIADLNEAIRLDPQNPSAYSSRAICWWSKREVDKAIGDCTDAIRLDPKVAMYLANRGILWNMKGEHEKAIADADAALHLNPKFVTAHIVRGSAFFRMGGYSKALAEFNEALRINPREATAYGLRARILAGDGEFDRAMHDFDKALELDPKDRNVYNEIARFYATCPDAEHRNGSKAVKYARQACELSGWRWASSISVLAAAYAETGDFEEAIEWQEKATDMVTGKRRDEFQARLRLYKAGKPLREEPRNVSRTDRLEEADDAVK